MTFEAWDNVMTGKHRPTKKEREQNRPYVWLFVGVLFLFHAIQMFLYEIYRWLLPNPFTSLFVGFGITCVCYSLSKLRKERDA